jgi:lysyl-tRNA synthetase class II
MEIDLTPPYRRMTMNESVREATGVDFYACETDGRPAKRRRRLDLKSRTNRYAGKCLRGV